MVSSANFQSAEAGLLTLEQLEQGLSHICKLLGLKYVIMVIIGNNRILIGTAYVLMGNNELIITHFRHL